MSNCDNCKVCSDCLRDEAPTISELAEEQTRANLNAPDTDDIPF